MKFTPRNMRLVADEIEVSPLLARLASMPEAWGEITLRQDYEGSAHKDTESIYLRGPKEISLAAGFNAIDTYDYPILLAMLEEVSSILTPLLVHLEVSLLGRIMLARLKPGGQITEHVDEGPYAERFARFHVVLTSYDGNSFTVNDETLTFKPGECWWFNHRVKHSVRNDSLAPRVHLIFDAVSPHYPTR
jgi:hypothetical protein